MEPQNVHFIAIGGSAMHNLAIALHKKGYSITGSDDEIFEPSRSRLAAYDLLPGTVGWDPGRIHAGIGAIILGMHAKKDNPELLRAQVLNIPVYSYPEFLYQQTQYKTRIAIAGSHGKTTTTAMVMHVLKYAGIGFDYMVGASLEGFDTMVNLEPDNQIAVFEADEYLSSPIDKRSKFLWYKPQISVITGIAWDHVNVFPTFDSYVDTFSRFLDSIPPGGKVFYYEKDELLKNLVTRQNPELLKFPYTGFLQEDRQNSKAISLNGRLLNAPVFGDHNLQNMQAAYYVLKELGIDDEIFITAMQQFKGASRRLECLRDGTAPVYFDFAHAPSKVKATLEAVRQKHPGQNILACLELHTFSSLNKAFIPQYRHTMASADTALVYFNPKTLAHKNMPPLEQSFIKSAFDHPNMEVLNYSGEVIEHLNHAQQKGDVILIMSSGNFNGLDFKAWIGESQ